MTSPQERIDAIVRYGGFKNIKAFVSALDLKGPQIIYDIQSGKTKNISDNLAERILLVFPEINRAWLLSGDGDMLRMMPDPKLMKTVNQESVAITSAEVRELISQNGKLIDIIRELTKKQSI